jgi:hypothetical protein
MQCRRTAICNFQSFLLSILFGVSLPLAVIAQTNFAILSPDGAWTWYNDPRAVLHNGILYFGYDRNGDGKTVLSAFNPQTGAKTDLFTSTRTEKDDHDVPGLLVKQDGAMRAGALKFDSTKGLVTVLDSPTLANTSAFTLAWWWFRADVYSRDSAGLVCKRINN